MTINELILKLHLISVQNEYEDKKIEHAYTGDLLSDVMGNAPEESVLITIQAHKNTVAVAVLKDSPLIIVCNDRPIPDDMIEAAKEEHIAICLSHENQFIISGKLFELLQE